MSDFDEEDRRPGFRVIEGFLLRPKPKKASWPQRFRHVKRIRSESRFRAYASSLEKKLGLGSVVIAGWRGENRIPRSGRRGRRPWGSLRARRGRRRVTNPPLRTMSREQIAKMKSATREELDAMTREAWDWILGIPQGKGVPEDLAWKIRRVMGPIDPDGGGPWLLENELRNDGRGGPDESEIGAEELQRLFLEIFKDRNGQEHP